MPASFAEDVAAAAEGGCPALEVWLTKLETHLQSHSVADTKKLLDDRGVALAVASYQGGLLVTEGERKAHFDHFRRRLDLCPASGITTMVITGDFAGRVDPAVVEQAVASLAEAARCTQALEIRSAPSFRDGPASPPASTCRCRWRRCAASRTSASASTCSTTTPGSSKFIDLPPLSKTSPRPGV
ncbi:MAG: TIM barrel protein [Gemmataceae bacterium]